MSQENVELVRRGYETWLETRSFDFDTLDENIEMKTAALLDGGVVLRGHEGVRKWFRQMGDIWEDMWWEVERLHDVGDRVVAIARAHARGRDSGAIVRVGSARRTPTRTAVQSGRERFVFRLLERFSG